MIFKNHREEKNYQIQNRNRMSKKKQKNKRKEKKRKEVPRRINNLLRTKHDA